MFSALDLDLRPGDGAGIFVIGSSLWSILDTLRNHATLFPRVDVKFDLEEPSTTPVVVHIPPHLSLTFTGYHQHLSSIVLRRLRDQNPPLVLHYKDNIFSSPEEALKRVDVSRSFGPTYPGDSLQYPGVIFSFDEDSVNEGIGATSPSPDDRLREVKRIIITQKSPEREVPDPTDELTECPSMHGTIKRAIVRVHDGVVLQFYPSSSEPVHVQIGTTTAQDLTCELGPPLRVFYREDDRMAIHSSSGATDDDNAYFYNYFQHGVDFMLSGTTHLVRKIILHTNILGSPMFQLYQRCPWEIEGRPEDEEDDSPSRVRFFEKLNVVARFMNPASQNQIPSMLLDRADHDMLSLPSSTTRLIGFDGIIFEVTESDQIANVTLF